MTLDDLQRDVLALAAKYAHDIGSQEIALGNAFDQYRDEPEYVLPTRKTGVIVGMGSDVTYSFAEEYGRILRQRFPHVTFQVVPGAQSVAFEWVEA